MVAAIEFAHNVIKTHIAVIREFEAEKGTKVKRTYSHEKHNLDLKKKITDFAFERNKVIAAEGIANKDLRKEKFGAIEEEFVTAYIAEVGADKAKEDAWLIAHYYHDVNKDAVRTVMLNEKKRLDGRKMDEVRPIWTEVDYLPGAHGSAIFTRGETQSLTTVTLGTKLDQQKIDGVVINEEKNITVVQYDGTNAQSVYSGPYETAFFGLNSDWKLLILANLNPSNNRYGDIYEVGIR